MSVKAFELVPALERLRIMPDKSKTQIECFECCGKNIYIGTNDCFVIHFLIEEQTLSNGKVTFTSKKQGHKYLALKKPVVQLKTASALNRILVLCDNTLTLLNMMDLEPVVGGAKVRGVAAFCLNENPVQSSPFSIEVCVALKKKLVQVYTVTEDRMTLIKDVPIPEPALTLSANQMILCVGLMTQYIVVDYQSGHTQELFPYDSEQTKPVIIRVGKDEFLLNGPSALGMFATSSGSSERPPLQWSAGIQSITYVHPYIVALNDEFITVHSILDQQQKQSIPFQGGLNMGEFDGRLFVMSQKDIYALVPVAIEKQIQALLTDKRVKEALDLAKNARKTGLSKDKFKKMLERIQQQAGFIEFSQLHFQEAYDLFMEGRLDVRELLSLYPSLLPASSNFTRSIPLLHDIADINQLAKGDAALLHKYKQFLCSYLEAVRSGPDNYQQELDTALLKIYAETNYKGLPGFIQSETTCDLSDCILWLEKYQRHHALALLYKKQGEAQKAIEMWTRLEDGTIQDEAFPGIQVIVDYLINIQDADLVWNHIDWVLQKDELLGAKIFTERTSQDADSERMQPHLIVDFLVRYPKAVIVYLEYLVFTREFKKEAYHTHLAVLYLDKFLRLRQTPDVPPDDVVTARGELRHMLQWSNLYRVQLLLGKVKDTDMYTECAILHGKLGEHDKALRILVHQLKDYKAAENYCLVNSVYQEPTFRKRLFQTLLSIYMDPNNERRDSLIPAAVSLLNNNQNYFDSIKVLQILPDSWAVGLLSQFLLSSVRHNLNLSRNKRIERMLARGENLNTKHSSIQQKAVAVQVTEEKRCAVCSRSFSDSAFVRYPNGVITHTQCAKNRHVCPVTGKLFKALPRGREKNDDTSP